jgi:predicted metal-binding membrane protein
MLGLRKKLSKNATILVLASFAFMSVLGMGISMEMNDGKMPGCPFMAGRAAMCQMSAMEHIAQLQQSFLGIPTKMNLLMLAMVLLAVAILPFVKPFSRLKEITDFFSRLFAYRSEPHAQISNPILLAFSDGILNPRIYEPARI